MMEWDSVRRPKDYGGLVILDTKIMSECLMVRWIWKICSSSSEIWCGLLRVKYIKGKHFFLQ